MAVGLVVLIEWAADVRFTRALSGPVSMRPLTALGFIFAGAALALVGKDTSAGARRLGSILGSVVVALGLVVLAEFLLGSGPGFDTLLFGRAVRAEGGRFPGRPAPATVLCFLLVGCALVAHGRRRSRRAALVAEAAADLAFFVAWLAVLGYLFDLPHLYRPEAHIAIAIPTALTFAALALGLLFVRPDAGLIAVLTRDSAGGLLARRLLPLVTLVPFAGGVALVLSKSLLGGSVNVSVSMFVAATIILCAAVTLWSARSVDVAEQVSRRSEERLRLAQQAAQVGIFDWNIETGVNSWTPELEALYGLPAGGFARTEEGWENLVHPDDRAKAVGWVEQALTTGAPTKGEWRVVWPDGEIHWLAGRWQVFKDEAGKPTRMTGLNVDITERKRTEEALLAVTDQVTEQLAAESAILNALPWPVLLVRPDGTLSTSPSAERLLGFSPGNAAALEACFEVGLFSGAIVAPPQLPWRRRDAPFEEKQIWIDRRRGKRQPLRVQARRVFAGVLLILEPEGEPVPVDRVQLALSTIRQALRPKGDALPVHDLLYLLVQFACELTGARYGALGVLARDGASLRDFIHVGLSDEQAQRIGHLPVGKGLLGAVIHERRTLSVPDVGADPRSVGFPAHHPPMHSFLGTPLRIGDRVYGNFYVTEKHGAASFTEEDAGRLERFSAQAALAVAFAEQAEEESKRIFRALVEHAPYGIVFYPTGAAEPFGNPAAERMLGPIGAEDDPQRPFELLRPDGTPLPAAEAPGQRARGGDAPINVEVVIARPDQPPIPALVSAAPVLSEAGTVIGAVVVYQDISTLKELERLRAEFSALVAHDMRTPVSSVMLQIELMLRRAQGEATWVPVSTLESMKRSGTYLTRLISDLLDASRLDAHRFQLEREVFSAEEAVRRLVERLQITLGGRRVILEAHGAPMVWADAFHFDQVLTNLIDNAAKYSHEHAPVRIEVAAERGGALISVHDQGPGIPPDELTHLFDRYFRGRSARKGRRGGLGLGLYITRGLVEAHGGSLTATSSVGAGSTFLVWLPGPPQGLEAEHHVPRQ
ncbi:MAG TPA: ATP-binding protein [Polyangia bacterium]|jgi:PAS domain S-box-containing protein